jgi:hypothetical protein
MWSYLYDLDTRDFVSVLRFEADQTKIQYSKIIQSFQKSLLEF